MKEWLRGLWYWLAARDPALDFDRRLGRWVNVATATGTAVTVGGWAVGSLLDLPPSAGLLIGLVAWVAVLNAFVAAGRRSLRPTGTPGGRTHPPTAEGPDGLRQELRETKADLRRSKQESERLRTERDELRERLGLAQAGPVEKLDDANLKRRCLALAEELHQFLEDHALDEADRAEMMVADFGLDIARADTETMSRFRKSLKRQVMEMLAELNRRNLWVPAAPGPEERERLERPSHPRDLQLIAERLERVGYDL